MCRCCKSLPAEFVAHFAAFSFFFFSFLFLFSFFLLLFFFLFSFFSLFVCLSQLPLCFSRKTPADETQKGEKEKEKESAPAAVLPQLPPLPPAKAPLFRVGRVRKLPAGTSSCNGISCLVRDPMTGRDQPRRCGEACAKYRFCGNGCRFFARCGGFRSITRGGAMVCSWCKTHTKSASLKYEAHDGQDTTSSEMLPSPPVAVDGKVEPGPPQVDAISMSHTIKEVVHISEMYATELCLINDSIDSFVQKQHSDIQAFATDMKKRVATLKDKARHTLAVCKNSLFDIGLKNKSIEIEDSDLTDYEDDDQIKHEDQNKEKAKKKEPSTKNDGNSLVTRRTSKKRTRAVLEEEEDI
jgi:hypothetical protein